MASDLIINEYITIPQQELSFTFVRSSGPGGQNVNKVNTKAALRWTPAKSTALSEPVLARLLSHCRSRLTDQGELLITSDRFRSQPRNIEDCLSRLRAIILSVATPPRIRRKTRKPRGANEARLREKRAQAQKKSQRRHRGGADD